MTFSGNSAERHGGGMCLSSNPNLNLNSSNPTLTDVIFSNNTASSGGGMALIDSNPTLTGVTFSGNTAGVFGGGMYIGSSSPTLANWPAPQKLYQVLS